MARKAQETEGKAARPRVGFWGCAAFCFLLYFLYIGLRVEPVLQYHQAAPEFFLETAFFRSFLDRPGGILEYAAAFLAQCYQFNWLGAAIATGITGLMVFAARALSIQAGQGAIGAVCIVPAILMLMLQSDYSGMNLEVGLGVSLALVMAAGYAVWRARTAGIRWALFGMAAAGLFYAGGIGPVLLLSALGGVVEGAIRRRWWLGSGCLLPGLAALFWQAKVDGSSMAGWFDRPGGAVHRWWILVALLIYFPLVMLARNWLPHRAPAAKGSASAKRIGSWKRFYSAVRWAGPVQAVSAAVLILAGAGLAWVSLDQQEKTSAQVEFYADRNSWEQCLAAGKRLKALDRTSHTCLVLAMHGSGQIAQDLFSLPARPGMDLLPRLKGGLHSCRVQGRVLFELGQVNLAEHLIHEALENEGGRPKILELLGGIHIVKGRPEAARVFLNRLAMVPFHRRRAHALLLRLEADPALSSDERIARARSRMVATDQPGNAVPTEALMVQLLEANRQNRMAFDYLVGQLLLNHHLDRLAFELKRLDELGYDSLPRHVEEAMLVYQRTPGMPSVDLGRRSIRPETARRFDAFIASVNGGMDRTAEGRQAMARQFGDTYWYYHYQCLQAGGPATRPSTLP